MRLGAESQSLFALEALELDNPRESEARVDGMLRTRRRALLRWALRGGVGVGHGSGDGHEGKMQESLSGLRGLRRWCRKRGLEVLEPGPRLI